jgi:hypothetical protein
MKRTLNLYLIKRYHYADWVDTDTFIQCALSIEKSVFRKSVRWFITSDNEGFLNRLKSNYSSPKTIFTKGRIVHVARSSAGYYRTLLDLELLSKCDEVIITGGSTYGFLSALKRGKYPLFVNGGARSNKCERFSFSNPSVTRGGKAAVI